MIGIASANSTLHLYFGVVLIQANVSKRFSGFLSVLKNSGSLSDLLRKHCLPHEQGRSRAGFREGINIIFSRLTLHRCGLLVTSSSATGERLRFRVVVAIRLRRGLGTKLWTTGEQNKTFAIRVVQAVL